MGEVSKQITKTMNGIRREAERVAHGEVVKSAASIVAALEREVGNVYDSRNEKSKDQLHADVKRVAKLANISLENEEVDEIVSTIISGERPTFQAEIRISGLD